VDELFMSLKKGFSKITLKRALKNIKNSHGLRITGTDHGFFLSAANLFKEY